MACGKTIRFALVPGVCLLAGGVLGWTLKQESQGSVAGPDATATARTRPSRPVTVSPHRFDAEFKAIKKHDFAINPQDPAQDLNYLEALASALIKKAGGYARLEQDDSQAFSQILKAMAERDLERTLTWIDQLSDKGRIRLYESAINDGMDGQPVRSRLDLFKGRNFTADEIGDYAGYLMMGFEALSTETALYLLGHVQPSKNGGSAGGDARFDKSFDYAGFAEATFQMSRANGDKPPSSYLVNFFQEWTRIDPQAAAGFYFTRCIGKGGVKFPFNTLDSFMKELHANISPADYDNFLGSAISQQLAAKVPDKQLVNELMQTGLASPDALVVALDSIPDKALREKLIIDTVGRVAQANLNQGGDLMQLRGALSLFKDPTERLGSVEGYVREVDAQGIDRERLIHNLCTQLAILGHSDGDLQRVRDAAGKHARRGNPGGLAAPFRSVPLSWGTSRRT